MKKNFDLLIIVVLLGMFSFLLWFVYSNPSLSIEDIFVNYIGQILIILLFVLFLFALFFANRKIYKKYYLSGDLNNNLDYYRELLNEYSSASLYNLFYLTADYPNLMIVGLLDLERRNKIKIEDEIIIEEDDPFLKPSDLFLMKCIQEKNFCIDSYLEYEKLVKSETLEFGLLYKAYKPFVKYWDYKLVGIYGIFFAIICLIGFIFPFSQYLVLILGVVGFFVLFFFTIYYYVVIFLDHSIGVKRTDNGLEVYGKLIGLRNFLKDFSILDTRSKEEIMLWDSYLIYSVMFKQNKKIINDILKFFN